MGTRKDSRSEQSQRVHVFQNKGTHDALQGMFWSKLNSGHGFTGWKQTKVQLILNTFWGNKSATISVFFFSFCRPVWFCLFVLINCDFFSSRWLKVSLSEPVSCRVSSGAATVVDHHRGDLSIDDLFLAIEIQHVDG